MQDSQINFDRQILTDLKQSCKFQRNLSAELKNRILKKLAQFLLENSDQIIKANEVDLIEFDSKKIADVAFRDRLKLDLHRIKLISDGLNQVAELPDPVNEIIEQKILKNGLMTKKVRSSLGVIFMIFESRPNVILEAFSLAFKSGNIILLRGGSESKFTAEIIYELINKALQYFNVTHKAFHGITNYDRDLVKYLLKQKMFIDVVVPRGGERLIEFVQETALMPIIKNDRGLCHVYVDSDCDLNMAELIIENAKTQRPGVCNSIETILVHQSQAENLLKSLFLRLEKHKLQWRVDLQSLEILNHNLNIKSDSIVLASESDWNTEHLSLILNCKIVSDLDEAISHIEKFGSKHSECIITNSKAQAEKFQNEVDAAAVYWNSSTRFTDGFELGLGAELGISTQKLHVRGPVGLKELTTPRWIIEGTGQIRE